MKCLTYATRARIARDELERLHADHAEARRIGDAARRAYAANVTAAGAQRVLQASEVEARAWKAVRSQEGRVKRLESAAQVERVVMTRAATMEGLS